MGRSNRTFLACFRGIKCQISTRNAVPTAGVKKNQIMILKNLWDF